MIQQNQTLEDNIRFVLDREIKNVKSIVYYRLLREMLEKKVQNDKNSIKHYIINRLGLTKEHPRSVNYWFCRGWTQKESSTKSKEARCAKKIQKYKSLSE